MLSANDIIINKLTQILSYLRQGIHNKKSRKKDHRGGVKSGGTSKEVPATDIPKMDEKSKSDDSRLRAKLSSKLEREMPESYAECYPGAPETEDAVLDSDDEVDYSKMDMGNKKGPIGRWDFDTQEEYSDYMSNKEAMPK
ncbi:IK [Cordylochernes scorpioides]|nr:IK [Cordylochernes scorpioides]